MKQRWMSVIGLLVAMAVEAAAEPQPTAPADLPEAPDLPAWQQVERAIREHPSVRAAEAGLRMETANRDKLQVGPHEFAVKLTTQRRREKPLDANYQEHEIALERAIRLPGKGAQDEAIGQAGIEVGEWALGDTRHETSRQLLGLWFDWQRESAAALEWQAQTALLRSQLEVAAKRVAVGDAAALEQSLVAAQLAQAEAQQAQVEERRERAAQELAQQFPAVSLPADIKVTEPQPVAESWPVWRERLLAHQHELALARVSAQKARLIARRLEAERLPDPTLGVRLASERDGQEHILGLQLSMPLPGAARAAGARAGQAEAEAADAKEAQVLNKVEVEARRSYRQAKSSFQQWQRLTDVAQRMNNNAQLLDKAWRLGEGQLAELQMARKQAIEAGLAALQAKLDANEARYRLLLDAHQLWSVMDADHKE